MHFETRRTLNQISKKFHTLCNPQSVWQVYRRYKSCRCKHIFLTYYAMEDAKTSRSDHGNCPSAFAVHKWTCLRMNFFMCTHYSMCILEFTYFLNAQLHVFKKSCACNRLHEFCTWHATFCAVANMFLCVLKRNV